jgi:predicted Zn-dependent peptidase
LTIATVEMPQMASVSVGLWFGIGSRYEPPELNGVCHFIEHLLFKGTRRRTAREISEEVESIGGYLNAFTSEEATCYHVKAPYPHFEEVLDVLMDMALHSTFIPEEIEKEREVIKEEIAAYLDEPQHHVQELLNATMWPGHPLGRPITGTGKTLDKMTRADLVAFWREQYTAPRAVLVACGKVSHRQAVKAASRYARSFRTGCPTPCLQVPESSPGHRVSLVRKPTQQTQIALGIRTCSRHDPRRFAIRVLNTILGEIMSSRLFQVIREERGLAYSVYSGPSFFEDTGDIVVTAGMDTDNLPKTVELIRRELRAFTRKAPGLREVRRARDYLLGQLALGSENTETQMNWLGEQLLGYGRPCGTREIRLRLLEVTPAQIQAAARDFFRTERLTLALVSPLRTTDGLAKRLRI